MGCPSDGVLRYEKPARADVLGQNRPENATGIAKGPGDLLYLASTFHGEVTSWEIQSDKTLLPYNLISVRFAFRTRAKKKSLLGD